MRSRKELIYLNIKDLTKVEAESLSDHELNCCDNCGEIEESEKLRWIDSEEFYDDEECVSLVASGMCAIDDKCYDVRKENIAQCGSCEQFFIVYEAGLDCIHCGSCNWVYGCIDEDEPENSPDR
jgi:hypothetical protein